MADVDHSSNPAGRLLLLLRAIQSASRDPKRQVRVPVEAHLELAANDDVAYFSAVAAIMGLPGEIRTAVNSLDRPPAPAPLLLRPLARVQPGLVLVARGTTLAKQVYEAITDAALSELEFTSAILAGHSGQQAVSRETVEEIRGCVDQILDALSTDSGLSPHFREAVRAHAVRIHEATTLYKIHGPDAIVEEWDGLTGVLVRNFAESRGRQANPVIGAIRRLGHVVLTAVAFIALPEQLSTGLEFLGELTSGPTTTEAPAPALPKSV